MEALKRAHDIQTLCLCAPPTGRQGMTRDMMCAVIEAVLPLPRKVLMMCGSGMHERLMNTDLVEFDIEKREWTHLGVWNTGLSMDGLFTYIDPCHAKLNDSTVVITGGYRTVKIAIENLLARINDEPLIVRMFDYQWRPSIPFGASLVVMPDETMLLFGVQVGTRGGQRGGKHGVMKFNTGLRQWHVVNESNRAGQIYNAFCIALDNDRVLIAGYYPPGASHYRAKECLIYRVSSHRFTKTGSMSEDRSNHKGCLLPNGEVFISGGALHGSDLNSPTTPQHALLRLEGECEIYNPTTQTWRTPKGLLLRRRRHTCTLISRTQILLAGGGVGNNSVESAHLECEIYDTTTEAAIAVGPLPRQCFNGLAITHPG
jgi:hypothetical protein